MFFSINIILYFVVAVIVIRVFNVLTMGWNKSNVCLVGKTAIITGGRSGLGYETALILASRGARVILGDRKDSTDVVKTIIEETKNPNVIGKFVDLADFKTVRKFADDIIANEERLDILINNAGVAGDVRGITKDGLQLQIQINYFGPFLLTHLLIDKLKQTAPSRIIFVSSISAYTSFLNVNSLTKSFRNVIPLLDHYIPYSNSKLCDAICSVGFAERLKGTGVTCNALHPGIVTTPMVKTMMSCKDNIILQYFWYGLAGLIGKSPHEGAQTHAYLAMANEVQNVTGEFFIDCRKFFQPFMLRNKVLCENIWKKTEELVNLQPNEKL
ncbi:retinol dehydrogenase 11-like [Onthophagus taurus]|uniref:retinol dehydrogenase 11-like n=1 Tax=Onthophagus taurus TaxID=166361 RepID=UPI0039BDAF7E